MVQLSSNAIKYTLQHLFKVAGVILNKNAITVSSDNLLASVSLNSKTITFIISEARDIEKLLTGSLKLNKIRTADNKYKIPVILKNGLPFSTVQSETLKINADIISLSFIMLSRYEELITEERDRFGRFEFKNSIASKYDFIDFPIVDECGMILREQLLRFLPAIKIIKRNKKVIPTHDIDEIQRFGNLFHSLRTIVGGDLILRKSLVVASKSIKQYLKSIKNSEKDPYIKAIKDLIEVSIRNKLRSEFYFMGLIDNEKDARYSIFNPKVKQCVERIKRENMIIGIHGGIDSYNNGEIFKKEKERIETILGSPVIYGRQHFLRFEIKKTIKIWESSNIQYDSTLGYAEREGFRCGTSHMYPLFDFESDCASKVQERPLIAMDETFFGYRKMNIREAFKKINKLYNRTNAVGGDFIILWHNINLSRDYEGKYFEVYCKFLDSIKGLYVES